MNEKSRPIVSAPSAVPIVSTFVIVFVAMGVLFTVDTFLAKLEQKENTIEASHLYQEGQNLEKQKQYQLAVDRFRSAFELARTNHQYQLSLAVALQEAGRDAEAEASLTQLLEGNPTDGPSNLAMARLMVAEHRILDAEAYYHRAIYGVWKGDPSKRIQVRFELVDLLAKQNDKSDLLSELLPLQEAAPHDPATQARLASLYLVAGSPARAADLYREIIRENGRDGDAYAGLAEAEFAQGNYRNAQANWFTASRLEPDSQSIQARLKTCGEVLALDPTLRGLSGQERFNRSRKLVQLTLNDFQQCAPAPLSEDDQDLQKRADTALKHVGRRDSDAVEGNISLAEDLWQARAGQCGEPKSLSPLALVIEKVAQ